MGRFRALVAYDGTDFHGWQIQPDVRTVEGELTAALARLAGEVSKVQGASRTDAGVHALGQVIHFDYAGRMTAAQLQRGLNAVSANDVAVLRCEPIPSDFNARHDARGKLYRYDLWVDRVHHPIYRRFTEWIPHRLELDTMREAAVHLVGRHDFSSFRAATCDAPSPVLDLRRVDIQGSPPQVSIFIEGTAFLKYMVRTLVGTLVEVGRGRRLPDEIPDLIRAADRRSAGKTQSPKGLHLVYVHYPEYPWSFPKVGG